MLLSLPALHALRRHFARSILTLAGNPGYLGVAAGPVADRIISFEALPLHRLHSGGPLPAEDLAVWRSFDRILSWTGAGSESFCRALSAIHPGALVVPWKPGPGETRHVSRIFLESLHPWLGKGNETPVPAVRLVPPDPERGGEWLRLNGWAGRWPLVAIHPGAGGGWKRWGMDRFAAVGRALLEIPGLRILVIEGPAEAGAGNALAGRLEAERVIACVDMPLTLLASVLPFARAFLGNDSGLAHLAAGLGVPSLVLFGPTSPDQWAPLGDHVSTLASPDRRLDGIAVGEVVDRLRMMLPS